MRHQMTTALNLSTRILDENPEGLTALAKRLPGSRREGNLSSQAVWRWVVRGIKLPDGRVVKLEVLRIAGRYLSSAAALRRFAEAQNDQMEPMPLPASVRSASKRQREDSRAEQLLQQAGI